MLNKLFRLNSIKKIDVNSEDRITTHRKIINNKILIKNVFKEYHELFLKLDKKYFDFDGKLVELGAGSYPIKESFKNVISTDIVKTINIDLKVDAENMPFESNSIRSIFMQNTFHHISDPEKFFRECNRVLGLNGGIVMIEPYYGILSSLIFPFLHEDEIFDKKQNKWKNSALSPMKNANQALSYVVFKKNINEFNKNFPNLELIHHKTLNNYLRYLISGGLNFKQILPDSFEPSIKFIEFLLSPLSAQLSLFHVLVIRKK
jgi:SAM-dependent methyltransferase